jgi:drug/metabolite transporter (DMT)-like permease
MRLSIQPWFLYAIFTTLCWGLWGAFIEIPQQAGFPATLGFIVWAISMVPFMFLAMYNAGWEIAHRWPSIRDGLFIGMTGAGGNLLLFEALRTGPAYIVFPFVSLYPVVTIALSLVFLKEKATRRQWLGIGLALLAIFFLSWQDGGDTNIKGGAWLLLATLVFLLWGAQNVVFKSANEHTKAESLFVYMTIGGLLLTPIAWWMTAPGLVVNWGLKGFWLLALLHLINSAGALAIVYAYRYGKALVVAPLTGLAPVITVILSLIVYGKIPGPMLATGIALAAVAMLLLPDEGKTNDQK